MTKITTKAQLLLLVVLCVFAENARVIDGQTVNSLASYLKTVGDDKAHCPSSSPVMCSDGLHCCQSSTPICCVQYSTCCPSGYHCYGPLQCQKNGSASFHQILSYNFYIVAIAFAALNKYFS